MSAFDVPPDEMGMDPDATDDAFDRILSGAPVDDERREVAHFVQELQEAVPSSGLASQDFHVAAIVETSHLLADKGDPVVRPVSNAAAPALQASGLPKQRRKHMKWIVAKVVAPIAAVLTVFGGMAYAGALPHQVQSAVSHAAGTVGIDLPRDDEGAAEAPGEDDQGEDTQGDDTTKDDVVTADESDDQGEDADDQGEDGDDQGETDDSQGDSSDESTSDDQGEDGDDQGEDTQGDETSGDDQGEDTQGDETSGDDQGGDSQSGSGGDQQGDSQD